MKSSLKKRGFVVLLDLMVVVLSYYVAYLLRFDFKFQIMKDNLVPIQYFGIILFIHLVMNYWGKLDRTVWAKISVDEAIRIVVANIISMFVVMVLRLVGVLKGVPISVIVMMMFINILGQFSYRFLYRYYRILALKHKRKSDGEERILIYGAGSAGQMLTSEILENDNYHYNIIGFLDDNTNIHESSIYSYPVFGDRSILSDVIEQYAIDKVIVAMPSVPLKERKEIIEVVMKENVEVETVTSSKALLQGSKLQNTLRKINISDLLERPEIVINDEEIKASLKNKKVLITGAGGSIGSELVRQISTYDVKKLVLVDISETGLYSIQQELQMMKRDGELNGLNVSSHILSIRDKKALDRLFEQEKPDYVYHAAAHKHVPLMEDAPKEAIKNNIFGTHNLIQVSMKYHVKRFINISTDKAVHPTNVMGATKRFNEMMLQAYNKISDTQFVAVRFGNVLGSNGSVVPLFQKQIERGGPVTVTHPDIIRYFMTIPEAVSLVLQAGTYAKGGEIFVLDMGEPVKILRLAEKVISLSGYRPYEDIEIQFTGLRPGEKLYEELLMAEEGLQKTNNKLIFIANPIDYDVETIERKLQDLDDSVKQETDDSIIEKLQEVVPTYRKVKEEL